MSLLTRDNLQQFCRACLKNLTKNEDQTNNKKLRPPPLWHHVEQTPNLNKWMNILKPLNKLNAACTDVQHKFPQYVCHKCYESFKHFYEFQEIVSNSCMVLTNLFTSSGEQQQNLSMGEVFIKPEPMDDVEMEEQFIKSEQHDFVEGDGLLLEEEDVDEVEEVEEQEEIGEEDQNIKIIQNFENHQIKFEANDTEYTESSFVNEAATSSQLLDDIEGQAKATKSYKCPQCNISYIHKYTYVAHIRQMHLGIERAFECEVCHKKYTKFCNLYRHMRLEHGHGLRQFKCEYANCNRSFRQLTTRRKHYEDYHNHDALPNQVEQISMECLRQEQMKNSKESPATTRANDRATAKRIRKTELEQDPVPVNKRQYICSVCTSSFTTSYDLKVHMNSLHKDQMKFACHVCGIQKISQMKLDEHITTVHETARVACDICKKVLKCKSHLRQHILSVHNGVKPYSCEYCPSTFAAKNTLKVHTRIHTGEKPFKCAVCDRRFRQLTPMKKHLATHDKGRRNAVTEDDMLILDS